ncbi:MAG: hypothetical protein MJ127_06130 [Mogibacterium sp.]|nr:hypothetical protein [Mogibacterium sp.]
MLKAALEVFRMLNTGTVLISCDKNNEASKKTIKNCGGKLIREFYSEDFQTDVQMYWIEV